VLAPYRNNDGTPKDWDDSTGSNFRLTYPSNLWTDISIPFWSMPENTDHPTQKPEKLLAKIILASSDEGDIILDPFAGSGTTAVVASKLNRKYISIEHNLEYCCLLEKRLNMISKDASIQGYSEGVFWERNSLRDSKSSAKSNKVNADKGINVELILQQTSLLD
jgi:site-specific DNA-methyltransferase (adenine-specific)